MKTIKMAVLATMFFAAASVQAQVSVNVNIGSAPVWGPAVSANVDYYFLPDINAYYDIRTTQYIYLNRGNWIRANRLPVVYRDYDLRRGRTIVINDYHGRTPYVYYGRHSAKYCKPVKYNKYYSYNDGRRRYDNDRYDRRDRHDKHDHHKKGRGHDRD